MPRSTFYYRLKVSKTDKCSADKQAIREVFEENEQRYGYRRITDELHAKGIIINHKKVLRLMKMLGIQGKKRKNEEYHSYKGEVGKVAGNLLNRDFNAGNAIHDRRVEIHDPQKFDEETILERVHQRVDILRIIFGKELRKNRRHRLAMLQRRPGKSSERRNENHGQDKF